jgi:hypothetical protein
MTDAEGIALAAIDAKSWRARAGRCYRKPAGSLCPQMAGIVPRGAGSGRSPASREEKGRAMDIRRGRAA